MDGVQRRGVEKCDKFVWCATCGWMQKGCEWWNYKVQISVADEKEVFEEGLQAGLVVSNGIKNKIKKCLSLWRGEDNK